jgi:List-Bact-rpt repeat protein
MPTSQPTRSVPIGRYALAVGAPGGSLISPGPEISADAAAEVADALAQPTAGEQFEGAVVSAQDATKHVEQAESLLRDVLAGSLLDPADLSERAGVMLKELARLDKDGRYDEWLRYARAINGLLALAMRWAKLVGSLRAALRAAEGVPQLERAVAWAEHELGTLHLAVERAGDAQRRLERAREIRERLGDTEGLAATEQSLGVLCRQRALAGESGSRRLGRRLLPALIAALLLLLLGGVAGAVIDPFAAANALSVRIEGPGTVTTAPAGIRCPDTCDATFAADDPVLLTASARPGATFAGWSGDCAGVRRCRLRVDGEHSVTARFVRAAEARTVTVRLAGDGTGEVTSAAGIDCPGACRTSVARGTRIRLVPIPLGDSTFAGWSGGGCDGTDPCALTVDGPVTIVGRFAAAPPGDVALTVIPRGEGSGTVTSDRPGISCPQACARTFPRGTQVTLSQAPDEGSDFAAWSGGGCSGDKECTVTLSEPREVTATFDLEPAVDFLLTTSRGITATTGSDDVGDDCTAGCRYPSGTVVTLSTAPPAGTSTAWDGCTASATDPDTCVVTMTQDRTVSATFPSSIG